MTNITTKKAFIDCGGYTGESIRRFKRSRDYEKDFLLYSFEPIRELARHYSDLPEVELIQKAVWIFDGKINLYVDRARRGSFQQGSTLIETKRSGNIDKDHPIQVECVDICDWINSRFSKMDNVIVKMNIEGAEYPVLRRMIDTNTIKNIRKLYVSFHNHKIPISQNVHRALVGKLMALMGRDFIQGNMIQYLDKDEAVN